MTNTYFMQIFTARCYAYSTLSRPSVCPWHSGTGTRWSHWLEYFENNFFHDQQESPAVAGLNRTMPLENSIEIYSDIARFSVR